MFPILIQIGPITLHTYGLLVALGFLGGVFIARREMVRQEWASDWIDQQILYIILGGILGARLFYVFLVDPRGFFHNPLSFFAIWKGGLVFFGGFIGGLGALWMYSKKKNIPLLKLVDFWVAPLLLAQSVGRLGCFAAGCCYGRPTSSVLGVVFKHHESLAPTYISLHPTQIYSSIGNAFLFLGVYLIYKSRPAQGLTTASYLIGYGIFRFMIEFLRDDFRGGIFLNLHPSQWISLGAVVVGGIILRKALRKNENPN